MEGNSIDNDDNDDGFATEEFDSSDNSDETDPPNLHRQSEYSQNTQANEHSHQDLPRKGSKFTAIASYSAVENTELSFKEGATLELLRVGQEGWWFARDIESAKVGWVPASYLEL